MGFIARPIGACWGFDTIYRFDAVSAARVAATPLATPKGPQKVAFIWRYVSLGAPNLTYDIGPSERDAILATGVALGLVQHVEMPHWVADPQVGSQHGKAAAVHARLVGYPTGCDLACDLEGVGSGDAATYFTEWVKPVQDAGYGTDGGVEYEGYDDGLVLAVRQKLYTAKIMRKLWKDYGPRTPVPGVGWVCEQHAQSMHAGVEIDMDEAFVALDGSELMLMALSTGDPVAPDPGDPTSAAA